MTVTVERTSPTTLTVTRRFAAPPARVWAAHMEPALIRRWCFGPDDWAMTACEVDARPGGSFLYGWEQDDGQARFTATGTYEVVEPPEDGRAGRTVHVERMHDLPGGPTVTPDSRVETTFAPEGTGTLLTMVMRTDTPEAMEAMVATGMTDGMEMGYARIDSLEPAGSPVVA